RTLRSSSSSRSSVLARLTTWTLFLERPLGSVEVADTAVHDGRGRAQPSQLVRRRRERVAIQDGHVPGHAGREAPAESLLEAGVRGPARRELEGLPDREPLVRQVAA